MGQAFVQPALLVPSIAFLAFVSAIAHAGCSAVEQDPWSQREACDGREDGAGGGYGPETGESKHHGVSPIVDEASLRLFSLSHTLPRIDLTVSEASEAALRADPRTYVAARFEFADSKGRVGPLEIGVRAKGRAGSYRSFDKKMAFKLDFNRLERGQKLFGLGKLNLNNMVQDPSGVREWLSYRIFGNQGVPVPRTGYARVYVNKVEFGVYLTLESTDDAGFLKRHFPSTSVLYEGGYGQDLFAGSEAEFEEDAGADPERIALRRLTNLLAQASAQDAYESLAVAVHWDEVIAAMATELFVGHGDGYALARNNYFLHFDGDGRVSLIPWGTDKTLTRARGLKEGSGLLFSACVGDSDCRRAYGFALGRVSRNAKEFLATDVEELRGLGARLAREMATESRSRHDPGLVRTRVEETIGFLESQISDVEALLGCPNDKHAAAYAD
ncbi:MAG: hypothetical protein RJA70_136 [Pseudomonadota bacterium]|jgi:hypothetical protein